MNKIYKTIKKALTGETVVASEHSKNQSVIQKTAKNTSPFVHITFGTILLTALGSNALAQQITYDGSVGVNKASLEQASVLGLGALPWLGLSASDEGLVYKDNSNNIALTGADLLIDYTPPTASPSFVIGGYSNAGAEVSYNTATLTQGAVNGSVYAGISHWTEIKSDVTGASSGNSTSAIANVDVSSLTANASNNQVIANNDRVTDSIYGGYATIWTQAGNATAGGDALSSSGAYAYAYADATNDTADVTANENTITVETSTSIVGDLYAGYASIVTLGANAAASNAVSTNINNANAAASSIATVSNSTVTASHNKLSVVQDSVIAGNLYGGHASMIAQGSDAVAGNASSTSHADAHTNSNAFVSDSSVVASENTITVGAGSSIEGDLYAGYASVVTLGANATAGHADSTSALADAYTFAFVFDSMANASKNMMTVGRDTSLAGSLYGGYASLNVQAGHAVGGYTNGSLAEAYATIRLFNTKVVANNNTINFDGLLQNGSIYGGYAVFDIIPGTAIKADGTTPGDISVEVTSSTGEAINNVVTIGDNAQFSNTGSLYGGYLAYNTTDNIKPETYDVFTGNTLNWSAKAPASFQTVANFENYNFTINPDYANTSTALITAQDIVLGTDASNISTGVTTPSNIAVAGIHSGNVLNAGDKFILMNATNSMTGSANSGIDNVAQAQQGISLLYDVQTSVDTSSKEVTATILGCQTNLGGTCLTGGGGNVAHVNPQLKALSEGYLAGAMLVSRGADLIADEAISAINVQNNQSGWVPFVISSAQHNRYNSGSHIDSNDFLLTGGISYQQDALTAGAFVEAGWGSYDSYNSFYNAANVKGDGNDRYVGVGLLGRYDFESGIYTEGSIRFGRNHNKFNTQDIQNIATGQHANYTVNSNYASAHVGAGYIVPLGDKNELDLSAKYLWTQLSGKDVNVAGDPIHFDRINSHRARINATLNHQYNQALTLNAGLGYEHEFDGKAKATTYGSYDIEAPSLKGGTGIVSVGANIRPTSNQRLSLDIKANGYTGKREGVGASIRVNYAF